MSRLLFIRCSIFRLLLQSLPGFAQQAHPDFSLDDGRADPQSTDIVHHGPYQIFACGGNATIVASALDSLWTDLIPAIDSSSSHSTSPAFDAFFKSYTSAPIVTEILTNISHGISITTWTSETAHTPALTCAFEPGVTVRVHQRTVDVYDACRDPLPAPTAFAMKFNHWIVLCPQFFTDVIPATPPWHLNPPTAPKDCCRKKDRIGRTIGGLLIHYRPSVLLHELVHQYLQALGLVRGEVKETYDFDGALSLSATDALVNPANYQYYVAALAGGCTDFGIRRPLQVAFCEGRCLSSGIEYNTTASDNTALNDAAYPIW